MTRAANEEARMSSSSSTGRRIFLVAGIAFAVVAIAYGVVTVVSLLSDRSTTDRSAYSSEIKRVVVEVTGDVRILGVDENVTTVERRLRW
jgi:multidrug resistance efflux pump